MLVSHVAFIRFKQVSTQKSSERRSAGIVNESLCYSSFAQKGQQNFKNFRVEGEKIMSSLISTTSYDQFNKLDIVIEAVFEDLGLKHKVIKEVSYFVFYILFRG